MTGYSTNKLKQNYSKFINKKTAYFGKNLKINKKDTCNEGLQPVYCLR